MNSAPALEVLPAEELSHVWGKSTHKPTTRIAAQKGSVPVPSLSYTQQQENTKIQEYIRTDTLKMLLMAFLKFDTPFKIINNL